MTAATPIGLIERIEATFGHDMDGWLSCFDVPMVLVAPRATLTFASHADAKAFFTPQWEALRANGFDRTVADEVEERPLDGTTALVDARFTRRRADGTAMEQVTALYVCRRVDDGWRVAALVRHE